MVDSKQKGVKPKGSQLYCYGCGEYIENTASDFLRGQGFYKYEHKCRKNKNKNDK